jgi:hypothetical protein
MPREINPKRRKYKRESTLILLYVAQIDKPETSSRAAVVDIGKGGLRFESAGRFEKESRVALRFIVDKKVSVFTGRIVRVSRSSGIFSYGVEFDVGSFFSNIAKCGLIKKIRSAGQDE